MSSLLNSPHRLYSLSGEGGATGKLAVEAWVLQESLSAPWRLELSCLSEDGQIALSELLGQAVVLHIRLADGGEVRRSGRVLQAASVGSDGALARYSLVVQPWLALAAHQQRSQLWRDQSVPEIIDGLLQAYSHLGRWRYSACVGEHLARFAPDSGDWRPASTVQYRQSDLDFLHRLLAQHGLAYRFEENPPAPTGSGAAGDPADSPSPELVIFADSSRHDLTPEDPSSAAGWHAAGQAGRGLRYHRDAISEGQDSVQHFSARQRHTPAHLSASVYDPSQARLISAEAAALPAAANASPNRLPPPHSYHSHSAPLLGQLSQSQSALQWRLTLALQAQEARQRSWLGASVVRSLQAGHRFSLSAHVRADPHADANADAHRYLLTSVLHIGINNLPRAHGPSLAGIEPPSPTTSSPSLNRQALPLLTALPLLLRQRAAERGYANRFEAIALATPWRMAATAQIEPISASPGPVEATICGPAGETSARNGSEVHTDRLGRVRVRYRFQEESANSLQAPNASQASAWVRVRQAWAGGGQGAAIGLHWTPRLGHQVLVGHLDDDWSQPLVLTSLYDGRGEGGEPPSPGGQSTAQADTSVFASSSDHRPSGQGNLTGGHSPAWHGASPQALSQGGQANAAALSGYKSKEFGGSGYNQIVFDDTPRQQRLQAASTQAASQLNLGHWIHQADNHRGGLRGAGLELRTDAWGSLRAAQGIHLSSYASPAHAPAHDNAPGLALGKQWTALNRTLNQAASTHQTVQLAAHIGAGQAHASAFDDQAAPIAAWHRQAGSMVSAHDASQARSDAQERSRSTGPEHVPATGAAVVSLAAKAGLVATAQQDMIVAAQENVQWASAGPQEIATGGALRIHTGQAIGVLGGAMEPGGEQTSQGTGLRISAGSGDIEMQAQADAVQIAAQKQLAIQSQSAHIDWAGAKRIVLAVSGGASITLEGGNIELACPGTLTVQAATKSLAGPERVNADSPLLPKQVCVSCLLNARAAGSPFSIR